MSALEGRVVIHPWHGIGSDLPADRIDVDDAMETGLTLGTFGFSSREVDEDGDRHTVLDVTIPDPDQIGTIRDWAGNEYTLISKEQSA